MGNAGRLDHGRLALAVCKSGCLFSVGVDAAEFFAVGIGNRNQPMMVLSSLVRIERLVFVSRGLFSHKYLLALHSAAWFVHANYRKNQAFAQVLIEAVTLQKPSCTIYFDRWMLGLIVWIPITY